MDSCCLIVASICHVHSLFVCFSEIKNQVIVDLRLTDIMLIADTQRILNSCSTLDYPGGVLPIKVLYKTKHDLTLHCKQWRDKKNNVVFFNNMNISPKWAALGVPRSTCGRALLAKRCAGCLPRYSAKNNSLFTLCGSSDNVSWLYTLPAVSNMMHSGAAILFFLHMGFIYLFKLQ